MKLTIKLAVIAIAAGVIYVTSKNTSELNLNVRNNNPLNIRHNDANDWVGQVGQESGFVVFDSVAHGFRAAYRIVQNYGLFYGANSIQDIITRWAPPSENHTDDYIAFVSNRLDVDKNEPLRDDQIPLLLLEMSEFEGAQGAFDILQVNEGVALA